MIVTVSEEDKMVYLDEVRLICTLNISCIINVLLVFDDLFNR